MGSRLVLEFLKYLLSIDISKRIGNEYSRGVIFIGLLSIVAIVFEVVNKLAEFSVWIQAFYLQYKL